MALDAGNDDCFLVGERVDVDLSRAFEEFIDQYRFFRRGIDRRTHVFVERLIIVDYRHRPSAEYKAGANDDRITYCICSKFSFIS
jgi:hypothetical protein